MTRCPNCLRTHTGQACPECFPERAEIERLRGLLAQAVERLIVHGDDDHQCNACGEWCPSDSHEYDTRCLYGQIHEELRSNT